MLTFGRRWTSAAATRMHSAPRCTYGAVATRADIIYHLPVVSIRAASSSPTQGEPTHTGMRDTNLPRVIGQDVVFENAWFRLKTIRFLDQTGSERKWTGLERTTTYPTLSEISTVEESVENEKCDAVVVFPFLTRKHEPLQAILIRQFRPPVGKWVIELPAGLIDNGEQPEVAAVRELHEETGYVASRVLHMGPPMVNDQGLTNGKCRLVLMHVRYEDQRDTINQELEDDEMIQVIHAPFDGLIPWLEDRRKTHGDAIDARLYSYALGLQALPAVLSAE